MSDLTPDDLARLRREAESASLHHYPLFSPETVLRLLDLAERTARAESERDRLLGIFGDFDAPCHSATLAEAVWNDVRSRCIAAEAEVERLRAGPFPCRASGENALACPSAPCHTIWRLAK